MEYLLLIVVLGFVPTIVAHVRHHNNAPAITVLNILSIIGPVVMYHMTSQLFVGLVMIIAVAMWLIALVWSATKDVAELYRRDPRWRNLRSGPVATVAQAVDPEQLTPVRAFARSYASRHR